MGLTLPDISKYHYLTAPKRSLERNSKEQDNPYAVRVIEPAFRTQPGQSDEQQQDNTAAFERQFIEGFGYLDDCQEHAVQHPHDYQISGFNNREPHLY